MVVSNATHSWLRVTEAGLFCEPGNFHIDASRSVPRAIVTHGHSDHARPGHGAVLATAETLAVMRARMGAGSGDTQQALAYGETLDLNGVRVTLRPAGHCLGSAQVVMEWQGSRAVVSGDYKRRHDPTCPPFEPVTCDIFVTEATFALPVFTHPPALEEARKLLDSVALFPERTHVIGAYSLGKAQRMIAILRELGWDAPIYLHGAIMPLCRLYQEFGVELGVAGQFTQPRDLAFLAARIAGGQGIFGLVGTDRLGDPKAFGQDVDQRGVDIVDAGAKAVEGLVGHMRSLA